MKKRLSEMKPTLTSRLDAMTRRRDAAERKAAAANLENAKLRQEVNRLLLANRIQEGWLNAEDSYTRRYKALEKRMGIIRDVLRDDFPERYGVDGAHNWFGMRDGPEAVGNPKKWIVERDKEIGK